MKNQPAKINYFFKDGFIEFWSVIKSIFRRCREVIGDSWEKVRNNASDMSDCISDGITEEFFPIIGHLFMVIFYFLKVVLNFIFAVPLCALLSVFQAVFLVIFMCIFYLIFGSVFLFDLLYRSFKKISTSCPACQEKYDLPAYVCECGAKHTRLIPSKYGTLVRKCECGKKLKTTFFNGRHKLAGKWVCPNCDYEVAGPLQIDIPIPVVGGPNSGKTCYINMAIAEIEKNASSQYNLDFQYKANELLGDVYADNIAAMNEGKLPDKTTDTRLRYYQFYLTPKGEKVKNLISICDVAGETYENNEEIGRQIGYKYANAFLMVVDPLSVRKYRDEISSSINIQDYGASERGMDEVLDMLVRTLENMNCLTAKNMIKTDVAIIFSKCDIPGLDSIIGKDAVQRYMQSHGVKSKYDATNAVCEQFLMQYEEDNFLRNLKSKFKSVQFFTCSALGHIADGTNFVPEGVEEPALWLIDKASVSINLKKKWGKKI